MLIGNWDDVLSFFLKAIFLPFQNSPNFKYSSHQYSIFVIFLFAVVETNFIAPKMMEQVANEELGIDEMELDRTIATVEGRFGNYVSEQTIITVVAIAVRILTIN